MHVASGRGSVFLWWRCDTLSTSGFVDDVTFSHSRMSLALQLLQRRPHVAYRLLGNWLRPILDDGAGTKMRRQIEAQVVPGRSMMSTTTLFN